ncbi:MAG: hypothetical protein ABWY03_01055, partial [Microbacterium sp.]
MNSEQSEELRMLRARAFGPSSDIHDDPAALQRLRELEDLARDRAEPAAPRDLDEPGSPPAVDGEPGPVVAAEPEPEPQPEADPRAAALGTLRRRALWAGSIVATAVVAVAVTVAATPIISVPQPPEARLVGTIEIDESAEWPPMLGEPQSDSVVYEDFYGLTALRQAGIFGQGDTECAMVFETAPLRSPTDSYEGTSFYGCGAGSFA